MEDKKKKYLLIAGSVLAVLFLTAAGIFIYRRTRPAVSVPAVPAPAVAVPDDGYYHKKPIKLELMTDQEKLGKGLATSSPERIQVLERDASGVPTVYHLVASDTDVITEY